jgi:hypothetical protein
MPKDHSKQAYRGIGFVTFASADSVERVMACKHMWVHTRRTAAAPPPGGVCPPSTHITHLRLHACDLAAGPSSLTPARPPLPARPAACTAMRWPSTAPPPRALTRHAACWAAPQAQAPLCALQPAPTSAGPSTTVRHTRLRARGARCQHP